MSTHDGASIRLEVVASASVAVPEDGVTVVTVGVAGVRVDAEHDTQNEAELTRVHA